MSAHYTDALRDLVERQPLAALGTLHDGAPWVSMVPCAVAPDGRAIVVHVSRLAAHTADMLADPRVSLLVVAPPTPDVSPQATARVTIQGRAVRLDPSDARHAEAKAVYLARFLHTADLFEFADFELFAIEPTSARVVAGFAQARTIDGDAFAAILGRR